MRGADARSIVKRIVLIKFHEQVAMDLVSVTVSGGYKPLYYRSRELGSGLLRLQTNAPPTAHVTDVPGATSVKLQAASCDAVAHMKVKKFLI